jgi:hypothetical protein
MLRRAGLLAALTALLVPAAAGTANAATHAPVVTRITPKHAFVGETLTIRGHHFRRGVNKNTVAFKRDGAKAVFVTAEKGTTKLLKVTLPKRLEKVLVVMNGTRVPTRLQIRVLSTTFGKKYTKRSLSPIVGAEKPPAPEPPVIVDPNADCDGDGQPNKIDTDDDNDLLTDTLEKSLKLDQCNVDSDGDGVEDGYEYQSARDLNDDEDQSPNAYAPYPEKKPYPNPLDGTDASTDHDGDDQTLIEEYKLWKYTIAHGATRTLERLTYSAGEQYSASVRAGGSGSRVPTLAAAGYSKQTDFLNWATTAGYRNVLLSPVASTDWWSGRTPFEIRDFDRSGGVVGIEATYYDHFATYLDDSERDEDADGLSNWAETRGCMNRSYWKSLYDGETPYYLAYGGTSLDDPDSDGDGIRDGADDQDHDDVPNVMECSRFLASGGFSDPMDATSLPVPPDARPAEGWVNPFNPCLPHPYSRTCKRIIPFDTVWAPFNASEVNAYYLIKN